MCFLSVQKKDYPLTLASCIFKRKYLHFKPLTVKSLHHKTYQRYVFSLYSLHKIHFGDIFLGLFHQFFLCVLKAAYNDSVFLVACTSQLILKRRIAEADRSLTAFVAGDARYNVDKAIISE